MKEQQYHFLCFGEESAKLIRKFMSESVLEQIFSFCTEFPSGVLNPINGGCGVVPETRRVAVEKKFPFLSYSFSLYRGGLLTWGPTVGGSYLRVQWAKAGQKPFVWVYSKRCDLLLFLSLCGGASSTCGGASSTCLCRQQQRR